MEQTKENMMENRVTHIVYKGKDILYVDYSGLRGKELVDVIEQQERASLQAEGDVILELVNFTNCRLSESDRERGDIMVRRVTGNGYKIKAACFGITGLQRIIAQAVKRDLYFARTREEAREWLVRA